MKTLPSSQNRRRGRAAVLVTFLLTTLLAPALRADEESGWACLGFSDSGDYVAVERFGVHEDSGAAYSMIRVIDVKANRFATPEITTCVGKGCEAPQGSAPTTQEARARNRQNAKSTLAQFGLGDSLRGERLLLSARNRTIPDRGSREGATAAESAQFTWMGINCALMLRELPAPGAPGGKHAPRMIDVRLERGGLELVLQKDEHLPKSRGAGVYAYELEAVLAHKGSLLVVLRYSMPARQGAEVSQLFVTGTVAP